MKNILLPLTCLLAAGLAGCGADFNAKQIIEYNTDPGKVRENIAGTGEHLLEAGRIDLHRSYAMPDGVEIDVWVLRAKNPSGREQANAPKGTVVILHGLSESKASFPYFGAGQELATLGYDVILPDLRAHGRSGGKYVTYGAKEKHDVKAVVSNLLSEGEVCEPIYAFGATLGGATAIQYAAIDNRCKGVMAMTPYKDAVSIARRRLMMLSDDDFQAALDKAAKLAKFDPAEASSERAAGKLDCPLLLAHGMIDLTVPPEHSEAIYAAAAGPKKLILITPGPEQIAMFTIMEKWVAEKVDMLARTGLKEQAGQ